MLLGDSVTLLGHAVAPSGDSVALLGQCVALEGHLGSHESRGVAVERALGPLGAGELVGSDPRRIAGRLGGQIAVSGGLVSL